MLIEHHRCKRRLDDRLQFVACPPLDSPAPPLHRERERQIVDATRALFDESGRQDARIDRIARRVGINKALVYRHFVSKEELFALTTTRYLAEINALLDAVDDERTSPSERLSARLRGVCRLRHRAPRVP